MVQRCDELEKNFLQLALLTMPIFNARSATLIKFKRDGSCMRVFFVRIFF